MKDLKQLQVLEQKYKNELTVLKAEVSRLQTEIMSKQETVKSIQREITQLTKEPLVTEHAMLRYFERVLGFDIADIKNKIMPTEVLRQIKLLGDGEYPVENFSIKCRQGAIVTVLTKDICEN